MDRIIQQLFDQCPQNSLVDLPCGEFQGPFYIRKPCMIMGHNTVLWAKQGPVLVVESQQVTLKNLRIETMKQAPHEICLQAPTTINMEDVAVNGPVQGILGEEGQWQLPRMLDCGCFPAHQEASFYFEMEVPVSVTLVSRIDGLRIHPVALSPGKHKVSLLLEALPENMCVYGELLVISRLVHRIYIAGKTGMKGNFEEKGPLFAVQDRPVAHSLMSSENSKLPLPCQSAGSSLPAMFTTPSFKPDPASLLIKGQKLKLDDCMTGRIQMTLFYEANGAAMEVEPYVFVLGEDEKITREKDFVFFGNQIAQGGAIRYWPENQKTVEVDVHKLSSAVKRVVVVYAIYGDNPEDDFSKIHSLMITMQSSKNSPLYFAPRDLKNEKAVVAFEFYRYQGQWKLSAVGGGYQDGLKALCRSYGLEVI